MELLEDDPGENMEEYWSEWSDDFVTSVDESVSKEDTLDDQPLIKFTTNRRLLYLHRRRLLTKQRTKTSYIVKKARTILRRIPRRKPTDSNVQAKYSFRPKRRLTYLDKSEFNTSVVEDNMSSSESYIPSPSDTENSSSSTEVSPGKKLPQKQRKKKQVKAKHGKRKNLQVKRIASNSKSFKRKSNNKQLTQEEKQLRLALGKSRRMDFIRMRLQKYHKARLDNILNSNGLKRKAVSANGDCFFNAVLSQIPDHDMFRNSESLRKELVKHFQENVEHYISFIAVDISAMSNKREIFLGKVQHLSEPGHWNTDLGDCMPLAIANILKSTVQIYSSIISRPLLEIKPDLDEHSEQVIKLAYVACQGHKHYDGTMPLQTSEKSISDADENNQASPAVTPRKQASYVSPEKDIRTRKRKRMPEKWKRNKRKNCKDHGQEYTSRRGKIIQKKAVKYKDCSRCRFKCSSAITEDDAKSIFNTYWSLGSYERQRNFICHHVLEETSKRKSTNRRQKSYKFCFSLADKNDKSQTQSVRVCKQFFLGVLNIGKKTVEYAVKQKSYGCFVGKDKRGMKQSINKTSQDKLDEIRNHINSFPTVSSHYTRKDTARKYLNASLSIKKMYEMYQDVCNKKGIEHCRFNIYRSIFVNEYNFSFHKPKKDQCALCSKYTSCKDKGAVDLDLQNQYELHQSLKQASRLAKQADKTRAMQDSSFVAATFDLEAVLPTPHTKVGDAFYKRCLSTYNLTIYSLGDRTGTCFLWDETNGGRGSCEIGTCLINYISSLPSTVKEIVLYSDTCGGQNRNQYVSVGMMYAMNKNKTIQKIGHKFFERGHSEMECDSMHAAIEHAKKHTDVYVPSQWDTIIAMARRNKPYFVIPVRFNDIYDLKSFKKAVATNTKCSVKNEKVSWLDIKWIELRRCQPGSIFVNYSYEDDSFIEIPLRKTTRMGRPGANTEILYLYKDKIPISVNKKVDLMSMCSLSIIPSCFHSYYDSLPTSSKVVDKLPEPDMEDSDVDTDEN